MNIRKSYYNTGGLVGGQVKLDKNKDGKISGADFKMMMDGGKMVARKYDRGGMSPEKPANVEELLMMLSEFGVPEENMEKIIYLIQGDKPSNIPPAGFNPEVLK